MLTHLHPSTCRFTLKGVPLFTVPPPLRNGGTVGWSALNLICHRPLFLHYVLDFVYLEARLVIEVEGGRMLDNGITTNSEAHGLSNADFGYCVFGTLK